MFWGPRGGLLWCGSAGIRVISSSPFVLLHQGSSLFLFHQTLQGGPCLLFTTWFPRSRKTQIQFTWRGKTPVPANPVTPNSTYSPTTCLDSVPGLRIPYFLISSVMPSKRSLKYFTQYFRSFQWEGSPRYLARLVIQTGIPLGLVSYGVVSSIWLRVSGY